MPYLHIQLSGEPDDTLAQQVATHATDLTARLLGKEDIEAYAREVVAADFEEAGHEDVVRKLRVDFDAAGVAQTDEQIRLKMVELLSEAVSQVENG